MTECDYLKEELGGTVAKGLAATAIARPQDPIEYLGFWLLHQLQKKEAAAAQRRNLKEVEAEREVWSRDRAAKEKLATAIIQREWRAHVNATRAAQLRENELKEIFARVEETADDDIMEDDEEEEEKEEPTGEDDDKSDQEAEYAEQLKSAVLEFKRAFLFVQQLTKSFCAIFKTCPAKNVSAMTVLKCVLYLKDYRPSQVDTPEKIKALIKPHPFSLFLSRYHPIGLTAATPDTRLQPKRKIVRVRRLLTTVNPDACKELSVAYYAVYNWLLAMVDYREARDMDCGLKRELGKNGPEDELDEEEEQDEEQDPEEEVVKAAELEAKRLADLEAAAEEEEEEDEDEQM